MESSTVLPKCLRFLISFKEGFGGVGLLVGVGTLQSLPHRDKEVLRLS